VFPLVRITELRVSLSAISHSISVVGRTLITLAQIALPVLLLVIGDARAGQEVHTDLAAQIDGVTYGVPRSVMDGIYPTAR
jgi:hypothetical protein